MRIRNVLFVCILLVCATAAPPIAAGEDEPGFGGKPLSAWIEQLKQGATGLGQAPEALVAIGAPALPPLERALMGSSRLARANAARVLGHLGAVAERTIPALTETLLDDHPSVRAAAALALGRVARATKADDSLETIERLLGAAAELAALVEDADPGVRKAAIQGLALMGGFSQDAWRGLLRDPKERGGVFEAIAALGPEATELAVSLLEHPSWHVRLWTLRNLRSAKFDPGTWIPAVAARTRDESEAVAVQAVWLLARRAESDDQIPPLLATACDAPHAEVRRVAVLGFFRAKQIGVPGTRALLAALKGADDSAREGAAWALGQSTAEQPTVHVALTRALTDKNERVRWCAARSLVALGETPEAALGPLRAALLASHVSEPYTITYTDGGGGPLRGRSLDWRGPPVRDVWPALLRFGSRGAKTVARDLPGDPEQRRSAIHALASFGGDATPHLTRLLRARDEDTRRRAALTLSTVADPTFACVPALLQMLGQPAAAGASSVDPEESRDVPDWSATALATLKTLGVKGVPTALEHLGGASAAGQKRMQPGLHEWLLELGKPVVPHLRALRIHHELGAWIDGLLTAIKAKTDAPK